MGKDEAGTLARVRALRQEMIDPKIAEHKGRIVKTTGDGILIEFPSVVEAVACAVAVQQEMAERNAEVPKEKRIEFRIGINLGDVIVEDDDIHGDGVNVAARLEALADPGGICVSRVVRDQVRDRLNIALGDMGEQSLKNIARPVRVFRVDFKPRASGPPSGGETSALQGTPVLAQPDNPSIAVLPFQNMSGDPEQEYFADGMVEEIITALSRIRWLFVIARNSSFTYKGRAIDVKKVGQELGVRYVLEGSVRKSGDRVRITAQLIEAETGAHLWADRFDGLLEDIFDLQDQVATGVAGVIEPALQAAEIYRAVNRPTNDMTAYDLYLRALQHMQSWERTDTLLGMDFIQRAIDRDPGFGPALSLAAHAHAILYVNGWTEDPEASRLRGIDLARRALRAAGAEPHALVRAAYVLGHLGDDIMGAIALADRALEMNPSSAVGWYYSGWLRLWAGESESAINHFDRSLRLSPHDRPARCIFGMGIGHFFAGRFDEAKPLLERSLQEFPGWAPNYRFLAACYAHLGQFHAARAVVERLRVITQEIIPSADHWRNAEQRERYLYGLRLAVGETE